MKQFGNQDQFERFHEDISKWDMYSDIIEPVQLDEKHTFYSSEEYSHYQR